MRNETHHHSEDKSRAAPRKRRRKKTCFDGELQDLENKTGAAQITAVETGVPVHTLLE